MKKPFLILIFLILVCLLVGVVSAGTLPVIPSNTSAKQLGGAYNAYTFASGDDTFEVFTVVPLTTQDTAYPIEFFYTLFLLSFGCLLLGVHYTSYKDHVPSIAILACGVLAFGGFLICAVMLPYTAQLYVDQQVLQNVDKSGVPVGNNSVYINQVADYRASTFHAYVCWGLSIAGFVEMILGALSFIGWFQRKGIKDASRGKYIETDIEDDEMARPKKKFSRVNKDEW